MIAFTTLYGRHFSIHSYGVRTKEHKKCRLIGEKDNTYLFQNGIGVVAKFDKAVISKNKIEIIDNQVVLSDKLYDYHFKKKTVRHELNPFNDLFLDNLPLILKHRHVVLRQPEYYLLTPPLLSCKSYSKFGVGVLSFSLGSLVESIDVGASIFVKEMCGYKNMYLLAINSRLQSWNATFWCEHEGKIVHFEDRTSCDFLSHLPDAPFSELRTRVKKPEARIYHQDVLLRQLITEVRDLEYATA